MLATVAVLLPGPPADAVPEVWDAIAACESDHTWDYDGPSGFDGGLQFLPSTWVEFSPDHFPPYAHQATPSEQVAVAERVLDVQGWQAWPACARKLGLIGGSDG